MSVSCIVNDGAGRWVVSIEWVKIVRVSLAKEENVLFILGVWDRKSFGRADTERDRISSLKFKVYPSSRKRVISWFEKSILSRSSASIPA